MCVMRTIKLGWKYKLGVICLGMLWMSPLSAQQLISTKKGKRGVWGVQTNALCDALLIPNIGLTYGFDKDWSVHFNWMYAWWKNDRRYHYWRTYGGVLEVRRWVGSRSDAMRMEGHHVGIYGQLLTYDVECGGRGYLGDKWSYAGGLSYGYAWSLGKRWRLDGSLGLGYLGGTYKEYLPMDGHYVWQSTKRRRWLGPTYVELSFIYLLGKKGGAR